MMEILGFTNHSLRRTSLFGGGIVRIDRELEIYNELHVCFCTLERHANCAVKQQCAELTPKCKDEELKIVGKSLGDSLTKYDKMKIETSLKAAYKKCRVIEIAVKLK